MKRSWLKYLVAVAVSVAPAGAAFAQEGDHGGGGGSGGGGDSGGGCGDVFGDLVHIRRDAVTGVPILEKVLAAETEEEGETAITAAAPVKAKWLYCPVPIDVNGVDIPLVPGSCDVNPDPAILDDVVAVDYFSRLGAGRTKERNLRMHFDEVIEKIKMSQAVSRDEAGRLRLGTGCTMGGDNAPVFASCTWDVVDSPLENLALYHRTIKYGHIQTDPMELDTWAHGDPATLPQYHVALAAEDWLKFDESMKSLLPIKPATPANAAACFADIANCSRPQVLQVVDFPVAASFLGAAADKHGKVTIDLVQYMNRILRVTCGQTAETQGWCPKTTESEAAPINWTPALIRDCYDAAGNLTTTCVTYPATQSFVDAMDPLAPVTVVPAESGFPANETFVNFGEVDRDPWDGKTKLRRASYDRAEWYTGYVTVIRPVVGTEGQQWIVDSTVWFPAWLQFANPTSADGTNATAFVNATRDAMRAVEFIHEYAVPVSFGFFPY